MVKRIKPARRKRQQWEILVASGLGALSVVGLAVGLALAPTRSTQARTPAAAAPVTPPVEEFSQTLKRNSTFFEALRGLGVAPQDIFNLTQAARGLHGLDRLPAGTAFGLIREPGPIAAFAGVRVKFSAVERMEVRRAAEGRWDARLVRERVDTRLVTYTGSVSSSLWESASDAHMDTNLIAALTEIFAWQVDFAREVRSGDRWRLTVEQHLLEDGRSVGWGSIVAAEYDNAGHLYTAALYRRDGKDVGYYTPEGTSLRRMFLRAPIPFGRISSRFMRSRFHPILHTNRPHLGVDYAAAPGTPIRAVGDGVVTAAGWNGDAGRMLRLRHNSVYQTAYKHLQGFAPGIHVGSRVRQGQIVAYVGTTGLSTGPHLHFEFYENGRFVDPLGKKFPTADPVPHGQLAVFHTVADPFLDTLPPWYHAGVTVPGPVIVMAEPGRRRLAD
ncbi:MAG TPA: peptidoglycan DD-metalloendopeptidase family protein [Bdellovibrionota bacterium]|jgi:murein DD-endopeptidase MepM/ murein hydrolase activator NlpD|nr:peptidoglycan DD-metalloendopeptidase family protein [Bdellovibrionota bacterium]